MHKKFSYCLLILCIFVKINAVSAQLTFLNKPSKELQINLVDSNIGQEVIILYNTVIYNTLSTEKTCEPYRILVILTNDDFRNIVELKLHRSIKTVNIVGLRKRKFSKQLKEVKLEDIKVGDYFNVKTVSGSLVSQTIMSFKKSFEFQSLTL